MCLSYDDLEEDLRKNLKDKNNYKNYNLVLKK